ncbi:transcription termination factor MTERF4, chloroplastic-like [Nicotiana tomentosiformis]|uniref:transcription termination factor MTERF4, chloroplastic-like n=1 Tax=Nicotiana tomentosiformis TaxID=4098 RepID=UPI00051B61E4|nr:transcription termination factor MTERF4, chloroplastic-like [Nicotiana tomentosiformis]
MKIPKGNVRKCIRSIPLLPPALALMFGLGSNGATKHLFSIRFQLFYSTAAATSRANTLVDFLVNSLGFSNKEAISTSSKVTRSRLRNYEPHLLLDLFRKVGMNKAQIKTLVSSSPEVLFSHIDKNLKPKIKVLQELGLSGSDLVTFINKSDFLTRGLHTTIKPSLDYLREYLGSYDAVARVVKKEPRLLSNNLPKVIPPNILLLQNLGFSRVDIETVFHRRPRYLLNNPEWLERVVNQAEKNFNVPRESRMFLHAIEALVSLDESKLERKLDIFRSFGWSDSDISAMVRKLPYCLTSSEAKINITLKFFMNELGYEPSYLASHAPLLKYSMEKRVKPRNEILKFLQENQLIKGKLSLYTAVSSPESRFRKKYVLPFKEKMPELYDLYIKNTS